MFSVIMVIWFFDFAGYCFVLKLPVLEVHDSEWLIQDFCKEMPSCRRCDSSLFLPPLLIRNWKCLLSTCCKVAPSPLVSRESLAGFIQVRENWKRSGNLSGQGKSWKVREMLGENFTFLYSCCNANNSRAGVQSTILLAVVVLVCIRWISQWCLS